MAASGVKVLLFAGPGDGDIVRPLLKGIDPRQVLYVDVDPLREVAAILALCTMFLANDSGFVNLAAAVGVSVVAIFGASDPQVWGPVGSGHTVLFGKRGDVKAVTVEQATTAVIDKLTGRFGFPSGMCLGKHADV